MTTVTTAPLRWAADQWENHCGLSSAVLSGMVPDLAHLKRGGPHVSIEDLIRYGNSGDYSNRRRLDRSPPVTAAGRRFCAAIDMSMSRADMRTMYHRARAVFDNRADPRRKHLNAINVWDGVDGHAPRRLDYQANTNSPASADHTWHAHEDQPRAYVDVARNEAEAWAAARAFVSMARGDTVARYWAAEAGQAPTPESITEAKMQVLVKGFAPDPDQVWLCDGMFRRRISATQLAPVGNGQTHQAGLLGNLGNSGQVFPSGGDATVWGVDIETLRSNVQLDADDIEALGQTMAEEFRQSELDPDVRAARVEDAFQGAQRAETQ